MLAMLGRIDLAENGRRTVSVASLGRAAVSAGATAVVVTHGSGARDETRDEDEAADAGGSSE